MTELKKMKNIIISTTIALLLTGCDISANSENRSYRKEAEHLYEAEDASFTLAERTEVDPSKKASGDEVVGYMDKGTTISWQVETSTDEEVPLTLRFTSPMAWIGVYCLPQTFDFNSLYTLSINQSEHQLNKRLYGSSDVKDHYNYYYWQTITTYIELKEGINEVKLEITNSSKRVYASYGNVDYISITSENIIEK